MKQPLKYRNQIPFYHDKTSLEYSQDPYERYHPMVVRQSMLHLADQLWQRYPMQPVSDYIQSHWPDQTPQNLLEIGCGVGRLIGSLADQYPEVNCWGIDYSYQMLKRAKEVWLDGKVVLEDFSNYGFEEVHKIETKVLSNLRLGLAKAEDLPFSENTQDLILSSFLLDRLEEPIKCLVEMKRVLRPQGRAIIVSPLNFNTAENWKDLYPPAKLKSLLLKMEFDILDWTEEIKVVDPLDKRGNCIEWKCLGMVLSVR